VSPPSARTGTGHNLAVAYRAAGRVGEAIAIFEPLLADKGSDPQPNAPDTLKEPPSEHPR
jgi:hypothetical protein